MSATAPTRPRRLALAPATALVLAATLLGLALRLADAGGDLGLDEVWSLGLVARVHALGEVFWGISHDNNHLLNSAWLYLLGPGAPVWADRLPALVFGTVTVPAFARLCGGSCPAAGTSRPAAGALYPAAGALAALLAAVALPMVDFGSEARGYAGLTLATVLAFDAAARRQPWRLAAAAGFGMMCHLTMAYGLCVVGAAALIRAGAHRRPGAAARGAWRLLWPAALCSLPALGFLLAGIADRGGFTFGDRDPFTLGKLLDGVGSMALLTAGLPDTLPPALGALGALALLWTAARHRLASPQTLAVGVAALVAFPLAVAALRLPNVVYARYYAVCTIALLALAAETFGTLWCRGGDARRAATVAALSMLSGGLVLDALAIRDGRDAASATLALTGPGATVASDHAFMASLLLDDAARRAGRAAPIVVPGTADCGTAPDWFIAVGTVDPDPADGATACGLPYRLRAAFPASPLSGTPWTLYRRH